MTSTRRIPTLIGLAVAITAAGTLPASASFAAMAAVKSPVPAC